MVEKAVLPPTHDEVNGICKEVFENLIGQSSYQHAEVVKWNQKAVEDITVKLVALGRSFKYCVSCLIMQTGLGAGLNVASTCYWDQSSDISFVVRWESKSVIAVCNVFAIALESSYS